MKKILFLLLLLDASFLSMTGYAQGNEKELYNSVKFGDTKAVYQKIIKTEKNKIGQFVYTFKPHFLLDKYVVSLDIEGAYEPEDKYMKVISEMGDLEAIISNKYGKTEQRYRTQFFFDKLSDGESTDYFTWDVGSKQIVLGIKKSGSKANVYCTIWNQTEALELSKKYKGAADAANKKASTKF